MDILSKAFKGGLDIFLKNPVESILGLLISMIISAVTLGVLAPVVITGYLYMLLNAKRKKKMQLADIFKPLDKFLSLWGMTLTIGLICLVLAVTIVGIIPLIFLMTWWMYTALYIADKGQKTFKAMSSSATVVRKNNVWIHLLLLVLMSIVSQLGYSVFCIGGLITTPIANGALVVAYDALAGKKKR